MESEIPLSVSAIFRKVICMTETKEKNNTEIMLDNVGMTYDAADGKKVQALTSVTMDIHKGEFISLLGPSGCGKTTLLRIIADLLQPTSGKVLIGGESPKEARLKRKYGMVF